MWEFDESAAQFPAPRAEEPANLRGDIVAELADHLTCARRREQLAEGPKGEDAVRGRVLARFGDPAAVARKLWLDWMWEKIMTQRILVGVCVLMAAVSCGALGLAWASLNRQQDMMAAWQSTSETQMREQQKLFERLLAQSERTMASASTKAPSDWNPVELRFVSGKEDGPPVAGMKVTMSIATPETGIPSSDGVSDERGIVRFERVRYGQYSLWVRNAAKESLQIAFILQPGQSLTRTIVCPDPPTEPANVTARIAWPDDLATRTLWFRFKKEDIFRPVDGKQWQLSMPLFAEGTGGEPIFAPSGVAAEVDWRILSGGFRSTGIGRRGQQPREGRLYTIMPVPQLGPVSRPEGMQWPGKDYVIARVEVLMGNPAMASPEDLLQEATSARRGRGMGSTPDERERARLLRTFNAIDLPSLDWEYRIEAGMADNPGTLWLTPNGASIATVRAAIAEFDQLRELEEKTRAEAEERRAALAKEAEKKTEPAAKKEESVGEKKESEEK